MMQPRLQDFISPRGLDRKVGREILLSFLSDLNVERRSPANEVANDE